MVTAAQEFARVWRREGNGIEAIDEFLHHKSNSVFLTGRRASIRSIL